MGTDSIDHRSVTINDPKWNNGEYPPEDPPNQGLALARMIAHITYLSDDSMRDKFGRLLLNNQGYTFQPEFQPEFEVESYLNHQGLKFTKRFDANTYLYITKAMDYFDLYQEHGTLENAFKNVKSKFLVISFSSDWLFPTVQSKEIVKALKVNRKNVTFCEIPSIYGHDAFLLEDNGMESMIANFLSHVYD